MTTTSASAQTIGWTSTPSKVATIDPSVAEITATLLPPAAGVPRQPHIEKLKFLTLRYVSATSSAVGPVGLYPAWDRGTIYDSGEGVTHDGRVFEAQWWTRGEVPGSKAYGAWAEVGAPLYCGADILRIWAASSIYLGGEIVVHEGHHWQAKWWTRNQEPGVSPWGPWQDLGVC